MKRRIIYIFIFIVLLPLLAVLISNYIITQNSDNKTFTDISLVKNNKVGLVLGTSKYLNSGQLNLYFKYRIDATYKLYKNNKIEFVLVSGDNGNRDYDEPTDFKNKLIKRGIPSNKIFLDFAGFRTLDSVIRAKEIFGLSEITIISQKFHNERAIYLAEKNGISAIGYNALDIEGKNGFKTKLREYLARTKAIFDILFDVEPKFLGKKIKIV